MLKHLSYSIKQISTHYRKKPVIVDTNYVKEEFQNIHGLVRMRDQSVMNNRHRGLGKRNFPFLFHQSYFYQ